MAVFNGTAGPDSSINDSTQSQGLRLLNGNPVAGKQDPRGDDTLFGFGDADILQGYGGSDSLFGQEGDDVLWGHVRPGGAAHAGDTPDGGDFLYGGDGNDEMHGQDGDDYFDPGSGTNSVDGGPGSDDVNYVGSNQAVAVDLAAGTANAGSYATDTLTSIENVFGSHQADTITGNSGANEIDGLGGNDTLDGGGGSDTAVFTGRREKYQVTELPDGSLRIVDNRTQGEIEADSVHATYQVSNGSDTLSNFESFRFKDDTYTRAQLLETTKPNVTVNLVDTVLNDADKTSQVTFTFSEAIATGSFTISDVTVANGALSNLVVAANGLSATATFTATDSVNATGSVSVAASRFTDLAGNQNNASNTDTVAINTLTLSVIDGGPGPDNLPGTGSADVIDGKQGNDTLLGSAGADQMIGGSGQDTVRYTRTVTLDLEDSERSSGQAAGDTFSSIESFQFSNGNDKAFGDANANRFLGGGGRDILRGRDGDDVLYGQSGRDKLLGQDGDDRLFGGGDSDLLVGGLGRDVMNGNAGADRYDFNSVLESRVGSQRDVVYLSAKDLIDLRTIDADGDTPGNQRFRWVDKNDLDAAFTGKDGQLRFSNGILRGDVDGDKVADFEIRVFGSLSSGDVIL
ncbi:Ig-like domain-containing protein [Microvirga zambiensis]|uniref:Ig-like domain-containing protein n=1 Tax=Microvirga zambiensis TaxID=1402137 RepID=UPI00191D6BA4|nr:Ig-like domain-containing protein [Microvirga zambiensis]